MLGRQGEALMVNAGLSDWIAQSEDEYVKKAIDWANADSVQRQQLATLRQRMREQVKQSPVFNAEQFTSEFVDAIFKIWEEKCQ
jgi:protein O-GlcNAc transferase